MRTLAVPYHRDYLELATREFGERNNASFADLTDDEFGYWRLFAALWDRGEPFAICEHDVVPTDEQWLELRSCPEPWCVFTYDRLGNWTRTMGFCAFDPQRLAQYIAPEFVSIPRMTQESREKAVAYGNVPAAISTIRWNYVDGVVWTFLDSRGYAPHRHDGIVSHRRERRKGE